MGEANWTALTNSLDTSTVKRGVYPTADPPNGGGSFVFAYHSHLVTPGVVAFSTNQADFAPTSKGASISAAIKRGPSAGAIDYAPFLYVMLSGTTTSDAGYIVGLSDENPHRIILRKGALTLGVPGEPISGVDTNQILRRSVETFEEGTWLQLKLDAILNLDGDVVLQVSRSDLAAHTVDSPAWDTIEGMAAFIDDAEGINVAALCGTPPAAPYSGGGYIGHGFITKNIGRRVFFDELVCQRQTAP